MLSFVNMQAMFASWVKAMLAFADMYKLCLLLSTFINYIHFAYMDTICWLIGQVYLAGFEINFFKD
jgi:hypothetical protein